MSNYRRRILNPSQKKLLAAQKVKRRIRQTDYGAFQDVGCTEWLVFPGFSWTSAGHRPPRKFFFCAREAYIKAFRAVVEDEDRFCRGVIIIGPKGSGKSCILRALAVELIGRGKSNYRVMCLWYLDARGDVAEQVRDALFFAFCDCGPNITNQIEAISTVVDLSSFLQARNDDGDIIILVSDGEEKYDVEHRDRQKRTHEETTAKSWLDTLEKCSCRVIKTLSPDANDARAVPDLMKPFLLDYKLGEVEYEAFLSQNCSLLWRMLERHGFRRAEVRVYAGFHPMSLFLLNKACEDYVKLIAGIPSRKRKALDLGVLDYTTNEVIEEEPEVAELEAELECYLDDDEDWQRVLVNFRKAEQFQAIRRFIMEDYCGDVERLRTPASVLKGYVDGSGSFCTDFLYTVHMRACLERLKTQIYRSPTFVSYLRSKLAKPNVTWPEVGWSLEGLIADAIMAVGLKLPWGKLVPSEVEPLNGEPKQLDPESWEVDKKIFLLPGTYSFKYVDGLIVWIDKDGVVHVLAIQDTVSPETHRKTEYRFMERVESERWYSGARTVKWYYVYLCPSPTGSKLPKSKQSTSTEVQSTELDMVEYKRYELQLSECFAANLGQAELDLLKQLANVRDREVKRRKDARLQGQQKYDELLRGLPLEKQQLLKEAKRHARPRKWLEAEAIKRGIQDPGNKAYRHMYLLLEAMPLA